MVVDPLVVVRGGLRGIRGIRGGAHRLAGDFLECAPEPGDLPSYPGCRTAQLRVTVGASQRLAGGREHSTKLTFTNSGKKCYLIGDAPLIQAVKGPRRVPIGRGDVSDGVSRTPVILGFNKSATTTVAVESLPTALSKSCRPDKADGLVLVDGAPAHSAHYVAHVFTGVCSNKNRDNIGASWYLAS